MRLLQDQRTVKEQKDHMRRYVWRLTILRPVELPDRQPCSKQNLDDSLPKAAP
mgnify:CR=1 FL=1